MKIVLIAAMTPDRAIGVDNHLPWNYKDVPRDMKRFRYHTMLSGCVLMGRKTYESIGKPLPDRENIVLTTREWWEIGPSPYLHIACNVEHALQKARSFGTTMLYVIGGQSVYKQLLDEATDIVLTVIHTSVDQADSFFPVLDAEWTCTYEELHHADSANKYAMTFQLWRK